MWGFLKRSKSTPPPRKDAIETAFIAQSKALVEIVRQQQETLDRIVTARYDRPIPVARPQVEAEQMPMWGMNDQGDVLPSILSIDSDSDFMQAVRPQ